MFHVIRNIDGSVHTLSKEALPGSETLADDAPEIAAFLGNPAQALGFNTADADFVRVIEDVIDTLISKNVIRHTDLPAAAQKKLMLRKGLRNRLQGALNLLGDDRIL